MKYFLTGLFVILFFCVKAQNLIPNPKFELYTSGEHLIWYRPDTPFQYYTSNSIKALVGKVNYNISYIKDALLNEQLGIQLEEKLKAGKKYLIRFNYKYEQSFGVITEIHCGFLPQKADIRIIDSAFLVKNRMEIMRLKLDVNELKKSNWNQATFEYTANGNESYFMLGYFKHFKDRYKPNEKLKPPISKSSMKSPNEMYWKFAQEKMEKTFGYLRFKALFSFDDFCITEKKGELVECNIPLKSEIILDNLQFESKSAILIPGPFSKLDSLIGVLKKSFWEKMTISGYTDNTGSDQTNINLSTERAKAVYNYMLSKGIDKNKIIFIGMGKANPIASNEDEEGKKKNRRVEILVE